MRTTILVAPIVIAAALAGAEQGPLHAGPMVAWRELRSAAIWVQTTRNATVQLRYHPRDNVASARLTPPRHTSAEGEHIVTFVVADLEPGTAYVYELYIDGTLVERPYPLTLVTQPLWHWRTEPPDFEAMFGSCAYINEPPYDRPGPPYGSDFEIFAAMAARHPDLMLWLGDNVYYREADFFSASGLAARYRHDRALTELQPFLAATAHYATWDDHDFGPNNSDASYPLKHAAQRVHALYWPAISYGMPGVSGVFQKVSWGDVDFFLLDDRTHRKPNEWPDGPDKTMLGAAQLEWLLESLLVSDATFKVVALGDQVLNPASQHETMAKYRAELETLVDWIVNRRIEGVLFISGDRHHHELIRIERPGMYPLYDLTSSSLTAGVHLMDSDDPEWENPQRIPGTLVMEHGFGVLSFSGPRVARSLTMQICGVDGQPRWQRTISRRELSFPEDTSRKPRR